MIKNVSEKRASDVKKIYYDYLDELERDSLPPPQDEKGRAGDLHLSGEVYRFEMKERIPFFPTTGNDSALSENKKLRKTHLLLIMDGWGVGPEDSSNAIFLADPLYYKRLLDTYPNTLLEASGEAVGLPAGQMGNSEVGHANMGAGRIIYQDFLRINNAIRDGSFFENEVLCDAIRQGSTVHLMGLLSDGGVHSHINHLFALLDLCKKYEARVRIHCFLDGRDVQPGSGVKYLQMLIDKLATFTDSDMKIASVSGRYYAMDRDKRWERLAETYYRITGQTCPLTIKRDGISRELVSDPIEELKKRIANGETDEFVVPFLCTDDPIIPQDSVIFFNFRPDRAREITSSLVSDAFDGFPRERVIKPRFVCMTQYDEKMPNVSVAYPPEHIKNNLGEWASLKGLSQLRLAETEKYAHVTFFFNNTRETPYENEERILVPSPKVATYDQTPGMSVREICRRGLAAIRSHAFDLMVVNFANCDMVGHTGSMQATIDAVREVDKALFTLCEALKEEGGVAVVTADHGNADRMLTDDGSPWTAHTTNPVPFIVTDKKYALRSGGKLCDIAPTLLEIMGIEKPSDMTGESLIVKTENSYKKTIRKGEKYRI